MIIYRAFSFGNFLSSLILRSGALAFFVYLCFHYVENPPVIITTAVIDLIVLFFTGNNVITVYDDCIKSSNDSISSFFIKSKIYPIREIRNAFLPQQPRPSVAEAGIGIALIFLSRRAFAGRYGANRSNGIMLELKKGTQVRIEAVFRTKTQQEIVDAVNEGIKKDRGHD